MDDLLIRPMPIRKIKNNYLRRAVMIIAFIPLILFSTLVNALWMPFRFMISILRSLITLTQSMIEFWNEPESTKLKVKVKI